MKYNYIIIISALYFYTASPSKKAIINTPIADLIGQQIKKTSSTSAEQVYRNLPVCSGEIETLCTCQRLHQLLYNDIVTVTKVIQDEACINISHAYCKPSPSSSPHTTYWILKKNLTFLDDIAAQNINLAHIPSSLDFLDNTITKNCPNTVTLIEPHYDKTINLLFSVGTRFVRVSCELQKKNSPIAVYAINYEEMKLYTIKIPNHKCALNENKTAPKHITAFVELLKKWAHQKNGYIRYVWGGTSFTKPTRNNFKEITTTGPQGDYSFYEYEKDKPCQKNGFDCSGMILRAAQICGIPYFCKNTTTIMQSLTPLKREQDLQAGDLILIKGHVMVVSDIKKNLLIEARGYNHGYGRIHEIPLNHVFDGIETYKDLLHAYYEKKIIKRKDIQGKIRDSFSNLQLFSMVSCFK